MQSLPLKDPELYNGDKALPVFTRISSNKKRLFSYQDAAMAILWPKLSKKHICTRVPISVSHNVAFIVDTTKLGDVQDVLSDDMGSWKNNRVDTMAIKIRKSHDEVKAVQRVGTAKEAAPGDSSQYTLRRVYRSLNADSTLKKIITTVSGMDLHRRNS